MLESASRRGGVSAPGGVCSGGGLVPGGGGVSGPGGIPACTEAEPPPWEQNDKRV